jgi:cysteine synthase A
MENMNPGGTGKDRAARSMILAAESKGELPRPLNGGRSNADDRHEQEKSNIQSLDSTCNKQPVDNSNIPPDIQAAIKIALNNTKTHGIVVEGTSGSTGIALASISSSRGHGVIVVMPDDQSSQKREFLERLGCGVVVVKNCSISNPGHYVNVAKRIWELIEVERKFDDWYWKLLLTNKTSGESIADRGPRLIKAAFMNQFENLANLDSHYMSTGPEIYQQLHGEVDAFVMSAGTGGTIVGVGGYLKDKWWLDHNTGSTQQRSPPRIVLVDPPGSSLYNKVKFDVAYVSQMSEQKLRRHRYDTLAEGIGLDRITANFGLGCTDIEWSRGVRSFRRRLDAMLNDETTNSITNEQFAQKSKIIDDAISITDQQAVYVAHYLLRHEGIFIGSSTAMNIAGALITASSMPSGSNVVTVVCDGGHRHTSR